MLFAAGLGTRLKPLTLTKPKALVTVNGTTLLEHNLNHLIQLGFTRIVVNVHHFAKQVVECIENMTPKYAEIIISDETSRLLDTGGGLKKAGQYFAETKPILIQNVDILSDIDLVHLIKYHKQEKAEATLAVRKRESSRQLLFTPNMRLNGWINKKTKDKILVEDHQNHTEWAFSGIHVISKSLIEQMPINEAFGIIPFYLKKAHKNLIIGFDHSSDYWFDIGTPAKLEEAEKHYKK